MTLPVLGFAAFSGTGKTTLLTQLIPLLKEEGLRLGIIKLSHHDFAIDRPGKDSYELHHAGASQTLLTSRYRSALITEVKPRSEPELARALEQLHPERIDLVLVEGFRHQAGLKKIELHRPSQGHPLLHLNDPDIIAIAADETVATRLPWLNLNQPVEIRDFILQQMQLTDALIFRAP